MDHIDEHTIELYILGSDLVKERINEIEAHINECHGCRSLAGKMKLFYENVEKELDKSEQFLSEPSKAIVRKHVDIELADETFGRPVKYFEKNILSKFKYFAYKHPVFAGIGSLASVALVAMVLLSGVKDIFKDTNPFYAHINTYSSKIEIYNKSNEPLWDISSSVLHQLDHEAYASCKRKILIADINGDNNNEIITTLPIGEQSQPYAPMTFFSSKGKILRVVPFSEQVKFRNSVYEDWLGGQDILCLDLNDGRKEILTVTNGGRSPNIIYRLSEDGTVLGQYFHFGYTHLTAIEAGGKQRIISFGQNDINEPDSLSFPVLSVLDPSKIIGKTEASDSRGFGLPVSDAELFLIRFPLSDMNYILNSLGKVSMIVKTASGGSTTFSADIIGSYNFNQIEFQPMFEYIFSDKFEILDVKFNSETLTLRNQLVSGGIISGTIDATYLENLKNGIRYWDDGKWQSRWTMVTN